MGTESDSARTERLSVVTTLVRFDGALGRSYVVPGWPAYRLIVPAMPPAASRWNWEVRREV